MAVDTVYKNVVGSDTDQAIQAIDFAVQSLANLGATTEEIEASTFSFDTALLAAIAAAVLNRNVTSAGELPAGEGGVPIGGSGVAGIVGPGW